MTIKQFLMTVEKGAASSRACERIAQYAHASNVNLDSDSVAMKLAQSDDGSLLLLLARGPISIELHVGAKAKGHNPDRPYMAQVSDSLLVRFDIEGVMGSLYSVGNPTPHHFAQIVEAAFCDLPKSSTDKPKEEKP